MVRMSPGRPLGATVELSELQDLDKGHIIVGDGSGAPSELAEGTDNQVLSADSAEATGLKWTTLAGGRWTLLETLTFSGETSQTTSSLAAHDMYMIEGNDMDTASGDLALQLNEDTGSNYNYREINATPALADVSSASSLKIGVFTGTSDRNFHIELPGQVQSGGGALSLWCNAAGSQHTLKGDWLATGGTQVDKVTITSGGAINGTVKIYGKDD